MVDLKHLTTVTAIRAQIAEARTVIHRSVVQRDMISQQMLQMEGLERAQYLLLGDLYQRHREVCKHPSHALQETIIFGRQIMTCKRCHLNVSSEKV